MDFSSVKEWQIPEGNVVKVERNGSTLWEKPDPYDYGDGHLNTVVNGYNGCYCYTASRGDYYQFTGGATVSNGNLAYGHSRTPTPEELVRSNAEYTTKTTKITGNMWRERAFTIDASNEDMTVCFAGLWLFSKKFWFGLKIKVDGTEYTFASAVANNIIKPLVIIHNAQNYQMSLNPNILNMYNGGIFGSDDINEYPDQFEVIFMLNKGHVMNAFITYMNWYELDNLDGYRAAYAKTENCRFVLSVPQ